MEYIKLMEYMFYFKVAHISECYHGLHKYKTYF